MDCEKFDPLLLDELYGELDELTSAAVRRHVAGCARCAGALDDLKATRRAVALPVMELPAGLEERILAAAREAKPVAPVRSRLSRVISIAGTWAMRPQTAMAAVFLLMIGTSAFVIRSKTHPSVDNPVSVTVQGAPAPLAAAPAPESLDDTAAAGAHGPGVTRSARPSSTAALAQHAEGAGRGAGRDPDDVARSAKGSAAAELEAEHPPVALAAAEGAPSAAAAAAPPPLAKAMAEPSEGDPFSLGAAAFRARNFPEAARQFDLAAAHGDANAALWAAESVREGSGCAVALPRFDALARAHAGAWVGGESSLRAARCQMELGQLDRARDRLNALAQVPSHKREAQAALGELDERKAEPPVAGGAAAAPKRAAPARPAARPAAAGSPH